MSLAEFEPPEQQVAHFPAEGLSGEEVRERLRAHRAADVDWRSGRIWSLVYSAGPEHDDVVHDAYREFAAENLLGPTAFPSLATMEKQVVWMLLDLLGADPRTSGGTMTSGGTESMILAVKAYRDRARAERPEITDPEMVVPVTAHPAFLKAGELLGVRPVPVPVDHTFRADPSAFAAAISESTILGCASAPCFPYGVVDPIEDLGAIAASYGIGLHVDATIGGFVLPFARELGYEVPAFDFGVPGVTSISADMHKYGYGPKGSSTVLYRDRELRRYQFSAYTSWPGGILGSPTILGTRPGGAIAGAWAAIVYEGKAGYRAIFTEVMKATDRLHEGIRAIPELYVLGDPPVSVFAIASEQVDMMAVADRLESRGWWIDRQRDPDSIHLIVNPTHVPVVDEFLRDLGWAAGGAPPAGSTDGGAALYGVSARLDASTDVEAAVLDQLESRYDS
ncbi:aspartate aminotransferase family protein [Actinobacteria bacterium YIM 96077]|uniref:Aspartate aminotransferase family protein n=1 Tax=Phytoactinopolyspora halophila TaxID=1981511 RepID=A0A329QHQ6_9ACTN|nr:aspartate aminotransferase family protein [Phytoactinopolyspora halophila]AYY13438.1 aspartate aminotransferase family protein [Actinobacteria bacterium YIM 96077]RAW10832.1 aspartate aminotransferase family protein [Phytoactinopolyspora halophila]